MFKINSFAYEKTINPLICKFVYQQLFMKGLRTYPLLLLLALGLLGLGIMTVSGPLKSWQEKVYSQTLDLGEEGSQLPESGIEWEEETVYEHPGTPVGVLKLRFTGPSNGYILPANRPVYLGTHTPPPDRVN